MAPFYTLYVRRSDGKIQAQVHGVIEQNEPTQDQLNQSPNAQGICDFYRLCKPDDPKVLDWRRKLGGMLIREVGAKEPKDRSYILHALPENYRLYEHVKCKANGDPSQPTKPAKNHAAGANERQDAYLYGYPSGRKKRFRSPNEFFPHLLWLCTDESGDPNNCSCKFCTPEEMEGDSKEKEKQPRTTTTADAAEAKPKAPSLSRPSDVLKQPPKERKPSAQQQPAIQPQIGRPLTQQRPSAKSSLQPSTLPRVRTMEQRLDLFGGKHLYRPGEVAWFKKGMAWGLGVIAKRDNDHKPPSKYRIQPLSHPYQPLTVREVQQEELRPWLAWSPPPMTCANLRPENSGFRHLTYDEVNWTLFLQGQYGAGDAEVDASILAAKQAETTYTPFDPVGTNPIPNTPQPQGRETYYNGIYLGAEKIWVGDALRLRNGQYLTDIIVLHSIIEQPVLTSTGFAHPPQTRIVLLGDSYSLAVAQLEPTHVPQNNLHLPSRVRDELAFKNKITENVPDPKRRFTSFWRIVAKDVRLSIEDIKGRWYESSLLLPILDPRTFSDRHVRGDVPDACCYMNGQGDCNKMPPQAPGAVLDPRTSQPKHRPADTRVEARESAFAKAVPAGFKIHRGLDEPSKNGTNRPGSSSGAVHDWLEQSSGGGGTRPGSAVSGGMVSMPATSPGGVELPGFGQEYSSQQLMDGDGKGDIGLFEEGPEGLGDVA